MPDAPILTTTAGLGFGRWKAVALAHSYAIKRDGAGAMLMQSGYTSFEEAQAAADALNAPPEDSPRTLTITRCPHCGGALAPI